MVNPVNSCLLVLFLITAVSPSVRATGYQTSIIYDDCVEAQQKPCNRDSIDGMYPVKSRTSVGYEDTICGSEDDTLADCTGVGWTFIGALTGDQNALTTGYDSEHWTAKGDNQTIFTSQFWSANVTEVCLSSAGFKIQFPIKAPSLRSLFFGSTTLEIPLQQWLDGIKINVDHLDFTNACVVSGFNVGDPMSVSARLGVVSTFDGPNCSMELKAIGLGINVPGKSYGSVHGLWANTNDNIGDVAYHEVNVYVRSRPVTPATPTTTASTTTILRA